MPTSTDDIRAWKRLGSQLVQRRTDLDPRYRNRRLFCDERGLDYRLIYDIENAKRSNFGAATLALIETGYAVKHGSVDLVLSGGNLIADEPRAPVAGVQRNAAPTPADEALAAIMADERLTLEERRALVNMARAMRRAREESEDRTA